VDEYFEEEIVEITKGFKDPIKVGSEIYSSDMEFGDI